MSLDTASLANIAIAVSAVIALVFGIFQVLAVVRERRERLTIEVVRAVQTREFAQQMMDLRARPPPTSSKELAALSEADRVTQMHFAQEMEMLGLLVFDRTLDLNLVERTLGSYVVQSWNRYRPLILELRKDLEDQYLSEYFQYLAERMEKLMREHPRRPAYHADN